MPLPGAGLLGRIRQLSDQYLSGPSLQGGPSLPPSPGLLSRVKQKTQEYIEQKLQGPARTAPPPAQGPAGGLSEVRYRLSQSAKTITKIHMMYKGVWRMGEAYSYRYRAKDLPHIPLLYVMEDGARTIKSFNLEKIQDIRNTEIGFSPRWAVEIR